MTDPIADALSGDFLLVAFIATLAIGAVTRRPEVAAAISVVVAGGPQARFVVVAVAIAGAAVIAGDTSPPDAATGGGPNPDAAVAPRSPRALIEIGLAIAAACAAYACLPDTELAKAMIGATAATGVLRLVRPGDLGPGIRVPAAAGLGATAVLDGGGRAAAVAAGLAIAALVAFSALHGRRWLLVRAALAVAAMAVCSRVLGLDAAGWPPVAGSLLLAAAVVAVTWRLADRAG